MERENDGVIPALDRRGSQKFLNGLRNRYSSRSKGTRGTSRADLETRTDRKASNTSTSTTFPTSLWVNLRAKWDSFTNQIAVNQQRTEVQYVEFVVDTRRSRTQHLVLRAGSSGQGIQCLVLVTSRGKSSQSRPKGSGEALGKQPLDT